MHLQAVATSTVDSLKTDWGPVLVKIQSKGFYEDHMILPICHQSQSYSFERGLTEPNDHIVGIPAYESSPSRKKNTGERWWQILRVEQGRGTH